MPVPRTEGRACSRWRGSLFLEAEWHEQGAAGSWFMSTQDSTQVLRGSTLVTLLELLELLELQEQLGHAWQ